MRTTFYTLALIGFVASSLAQTVSIPDAGLDATIRDTWQKPTGPLTQQDLLTLSNWSASGADFTNSGVSGQTFFRATTAP